MTHFLTGTRVEPSHWNPGFRWWAILGAVVAVGLLTNWAIAAGLLVFILVHIARPFDFLLSFLMLVAGASFVSNTGGHLTYELSLLTGVIMLMFTCYALSNRGRVFSLSMTTLTWPLVLFLILSIGNAARGLLAGYSPRYWGLELIALLAVESALIVANAFDARRDLRLATVGVIAIGFAAAIRGFIAFSIERAHTVATYTVGVPASSV